MKLDPFTELTDSRVGIVSSIDYVARESGAPAFYAAQAKACDARALGGERNERYGGGASIYPALARLKAAGEAVERYCASLYTHDDCALFAFEEAPFACCHPQDFALYAPRQTNDPRFEYESFTTETIVRWTFARDLHSGETLGVPAALVWFPYMPDTDEAAIAQSVTTGLACGTSFEGAALSAVCEVVERDAFTLAWQAGSGGRPLAKTCVSSEIGLRLRILAAAGWRVDLADITTDAKVPTALAMARPESSAGPPLTVATATHPRWSSALAHALDELELTRRYLTQLRRVVPRPRWPGDADEVQSQEDHLLYWLEENRASEAEFLLGTGPAIEAEDEYDSDVTARDLLDVVVERLRRLGARVLIADVTSSDVAETGLRVVRAIVPGLHPLFFGHQRRALGGARLARALGGSDCDNKLPHPFP